MSVRQSPKDRQSDRYAPVLLESPTQPGPGVVPSSGEQVSYGALWDYEATPDLLLHMVCDGQLHHSTAYVGSKPVVKVSLIVTPQNMCQKKR